MFDSRKEEIIEISVWDTELEAPDVKTFTFNKFLNEGEPGQFLMVGLYDGGEKPFSLSSKNSITVKKISNRPKSRWPPTFKVYWHTFTERLFPLRKDDTLYIRGPLGRGFDMEEGHSFVLIGGGIGLAPLRFAAETLLLSPEVIIFAGGKTKDDVIFRDDFEKYGTLYISTETEGDGEYTGTVLDLMKATPKDEWVKEKTKYLTCGPEKMIVAVAEYLEELGAKAEDIQCAIERYMKCGMSLCGSCSCGGYRVCRDGPVFTYDVLKENKHFGKKKRGKDGGLVEI